MPHHLLYILMLNDKALCAIQLLPCQINLRSLQSIRLSTSTHLSCFNFFIHAKSIQMIKSVQCSVITNNLTPQNPWHQSVKSSRNHLQQLNKDPLHSLEVAGLHATALIKNISLHAIRSTTKIIQMRRDIEHNPPKYPSNTPGGYGFCIPATSVPLKSLSYFIFQVGCCVSASTGRCGTQSNTLSLSTPVVFTLSAFFFSVITPPSGSAPSVPKSVCFRAAAGIAWKPRSLRFELRYRWLINNCNVRLPRASWLLPQSMVVPGGCCCEGWYNCLSAAAASPLPPALFIALPSP